MTSPIPLTSFEALGLRAELLRAVHAADFHTPTPVQAAVIAAILAGRDVRARAHTGSGKTAAFGLPLLQRLVERPRSYAARGNQVAVLVLAPTRELVMQIGEVLTTFSRQLDAHVKVDAVYGGVKINPQMMALRGGADVLVATPGRLLDLHRQNAVKLTDLRALVLDEADKLLSPGFRDELEEVLRLVPPRTQKLLFSATFPDHVMQATQTLLRDPLEVDVAAAPQPPTTGTAESSHEVVDIVASGTAEPAIEQHVYAVPAERKEAALVELLRSRELGQVLVFVSMKKTADVLARRLNQSDIRAAAFHGDRSQRDRTQALVEFRAGTVRVLLATDLAARGIDIVDLPVVINYELPRSPNDYLHRIGRTGRAGKPGLALSLICSDEEHHFRVIEKRMKRRLPREQL